MACAAEKAERIQSHRFVFILKHIRQAAFVKIGYSFVKGGHGWGS